MNPRRLVASAWRAGALASVALLVLTACGSDGGSHVTRDTSLRAVDVAQHAGIAGTSDTHGENCVADLNNDGIPDLILSTHSNVWPVYLGRRDGTFTLDKRVDFPDRDRHGCAVADFNGDGLLDVYMSIGGCRGNCTGSKELWIQQPDHTFKNEAGRWGITDPPARGRVPVVLDANGDGRPDLFTGAQSPVKFPSLNRLWLNRGDHFESQDRDPVTNNFGNTCAAAADIDGDGHVDLAVCTKTNNFMVFRNEGGKFVHDNEHFGLGTRNYRAVKFCDLNGDHRPDLVTIGQKNMQVFLNTNGRYGTPTLTERLSDGKYIACGDVNGDGHLDIFVQQGTGGNRVLLNAGTGRTYTPGPAVPEPHGGMGDTVVAIPNWRGTGRAAFVVNNGYTTHPGPRQLIEFDKR